MFRSLRLIAPALVLAAIACAPPSYAQSRKPAPKQEEGVPVPPMRPTQAPDPPAVAAPPPVLIEPSRSTMPDSAPRIGGLSEQARGGALCRTDCATRYYRCLSQDDMSSCGPAWSQCQVGCPPTSSSE